MHKTKIMGILNVTPDSFSDGGLYVDVDKAVKHATQMVEEGADIIDVGGESSRPGSDPISIEEELERVKPVIQRLADEIKVPLSIDTRKPEVAEACIKAGASIINDISGLRDPAMAEIAAQRKASVVIMHMLGTPKTMQQNISYRDLIGDIKQFLKEKIQVAKNAGIAKIIVDPGIGFGKTAEQNLIIMKRLNEFKIFGCPLLVGPSRKSFIGTITGLPVHDRIEGTIAAIVISLMNGADIVRVHDVKECKRAVQIADAVRNA
ncbi:MAG TPA: dihydropteroate synthase [Candidatus Nanoarchaeia archaeon]|nr:dihydropteroate synthase [Candidatus Nanoarchaeia archaeon]